VVKRGDVVLVSLAGDYGKTRPAILIQNDVLAEVLESRTVCLLTSDVVLAPRLRVSIEPNASNGLRRLSQVQVEKVVTLPAGKVRGPIGALTREQMREVDRRLRLHLDLYNSE
jgi:mRNA interferase MazF